MEDVACTVIRLRGQSSEKEIETFYYFDKLLYEELMQYNEMLAKQNIATEKNVLFGDNTYAYLILLNKESIGYCELCFNKDLFLPNAVYLTHIYIKPEYRKRGHGRQILDTVLFFIKQEQPEIMTLCLAVYSDNKKALAFYNALGFKEDVRFLSKAY